MESISNASYQEGAINDDANEGEQSTNFKDFGAKAKLNGKRPTLSELVDK
jgi:hypothetical protein